jgi:hypothetical protein
LAAEAGSAGERPSLAQQRSINPIRSNPPAATETHPPLLSNLASGKTPIKHSPPRKPRRSQLAAEAGSAGERPSRAQQRSINPIRSNPPAATETHPALLSNLASGKTPTKRSPPLKPGAPESARPGRSNDQSSLSARIPLRPPKHTRLFFCNLASGKTPIKRLRR